jgi:hypothetical protein
MLVTNILVRSQQKLFQTTAVEIKDSELKIGPEIKSGPHSHAVTPIQRSTIKKPRYAIDKFFLKLSTLRTRYLARNCLLTWIYLSFKELTDRSILPHFDSFGFLWLSDSGSWNVKLTGKKSFSSEAWKWTNVANTHANKCRNAARML